MTGSTSSHHHIIRKTGFILKKKNHLLSLSLRKWSLMQKKKRLHYSWKHIVAISERKCFNIYAWNTKKKKALIRFTFICFIYIKHTLVSRDRVVTYSKPNTRAQIRQLSFKSLSPSHTHISHSRFIPLLVSHIPHISLWNRWFWCFEKKQH